MPSQGFSYTRVRRSRGHTSIVIKSNNVIVNGKEVQPKCQSSKLRRFSKHWFPGNAKVGDSCLCGKTFRTAEEEKLGEDMVAWGDEMSKLGDEMSRWAEGLRKRLSSWG
jgi:hypothetical protein